LTVSEFAAQLRWRQILYRLYRHPIVMFGVGPTYLFILRHRLPIGMMCSGWQPWLSTMGTNIAVAILVAVMSGLVGFWPFLLVQLPITVLAGSIGVWLFYVQHQFEDTSWSRDDAWSFHEAALQGSSHYHLPSVLRWFTANIGVHHVHHLCSRISLLSAVRRAPGSSGTRCHWTNHSLAKFAVRAEGFVGREGAAAHFVPRGEY
jgi:omega-6 fatty acid desaturase (delta-12 desaturase)